MLNKTMELIEEQEEWAGVGGDYLPLSVWGKLGYDEERIRLNSRPEDFRVCPVNGDVYRVPIMSKGAKGTKKAAATTSLEAHFDRNRRAQSNDASAASLPAAIEAASSPRVPRV